MKKVYLPSVVTLCVFSALAISCSDFEQKFEDEYSYLTMPLQGDVPVPVVLPDSEEIVNPPLEEKSSSSSKKVSSSSKKSSSSTAKSSSSKAKSSSSTPNLAMGTRPFDDSRDNHEYNFVVIGEQRWMVENLQWKPDAKLKSTGNGYGFTAEGITAYYPGGDEANVEKYGLLYTWASAVDSAGIFSKGALGCGYGTSCEDFGRVRGICPEGWHIPSINEWNTLIRTAGGTSVAAKMLKATTEWKSTAAGIYKHGFNAYPAGRYSNLLEGFGSSAYFLTSSKHSSGGVSTVRFGEGNSVTVVGLREDNAFSVRCIMGAADLDGDEKLDAESLVSKKSLTLGTWDPTEQVQIPTGNNNGGWFHEYNDGQSGFTWPVKKGDEFDPGSFSPVVEHCEGICGDVSLEYIDELTYPYAGIGFGLGHQDSLYNIYNEEGICVEYSSDLPLKLILDLDEETNAMIGYANPRVDLPETSKLTVVDFKWDDFNMADWFEGAYTLLDYFKIAHGFKFEWSQEIDKDGLSGHFKIKKIGVYGSCE